MFYHQHCESVTIIRSLKYRDHQYHLFFHEFDLKNLLTLQNVNVRLKFGHHFFVIVQLRYDCRLTTTHNGNMYFYKIIFQTKRVLYTLLYKRENP